MRQGRIRAGRGPPESPLFSAGISQLPFIPPTERGSSLPCDVCCWLKVREDYFLLGFPTFIQSFTAYSITHLTDVLEALLWVKVCLRSWGQSHEQSREGLRLEGTCVLMSGSRKQIAK